MPTTHHYPNDFQAALSIVRDRFPLAEKRELNEDAFGFYAPSGHRVALLTITDEGLVLEMDASYNLNG